LEDLSPTLHLILSVREALERGDSVRTGIAEFIDIDRSDLKIILLNRAFERPGDASEIKKWPRALKETEKSLLSVLRRGLEGEAILPVLKDLEADMIERSDAEIEDFTQKLTLRCLIPLLLFVFPGYLVLLLGPTLERLLISLE